jgi:hypothetical protein
MLRRLSLFVLETPRPVRGTGSMVRGLLLIAALWRKLMRNLGGGYRPEHHYMRGPGPKWHERKGAGM